jgi:FkbM family methyltransferase
MTNLSPSWERLKRRDDRLRRIFDGLLASFEPSIVCEVGAFNGEETLRFHGLCPQSSFYLFEANAKNYNQFLLGNPSLSGHSRTVIEHVAVSDSVGEVEFHVLEADDTAADWRRAASSMLLRGDGLTFQSERVRAITLDSYFHEHLAVGGHSFALWIDVEGVLDRVLAGATSVLERTVLLRAEVEWAEVWRGQALGQDSKDLLDRLGFVCVGDSFTPHSHSQSDVVFVRRDALNLIEPAS